MKTLLLLRHAKSDWDDVSVDDHERPLNPRGLKAAPRMGRLMRDLGLIPALCLSSTAVRARDTATMAISEMAADVPVEYLRELYSFGDGSAIAAAIAAHGGDASPLLVVTHNPATQAFALDTISGGDTFGLGQLRIKYPTGGMARIDYDIASWSALPTAKGQLKGFWRPRDLM